MFRLDGKTALITGASGGIGAAIARALHEQGASVVLSGTRRAALDALAQDLGGRVFVCPADLTDPAAPDALVAAAEAAAGPLGIVVNNAGLTRDMLALRMKDEDWDAVLDTNQAMLHAAQARAVEAEPAPTGPPLPAGLRETAPTAEPPAGLPRCCPHCHAQADWVLVEILLPLRSRALRTVPFLDSS